ncbi:nuclear transport factor 2 family protein [Robiginitalea sp. M366]|uniref:nuclear transport factor 2 family protein n=1 Tax=Robiginitalea aestuariiviva TaxID=3036903 RepID=UPI00240CEBC5|nr:nuclear transport factor 2 family protein [Robiginitalea aestuariiviva]MDG1573087.1 nuclear transport factor 2 family protein [Robiginitalea aestuariiviva]
MKATFKHIAALLLLGLLTFSTQAQSEQQRAVRRTIDQFFEGYHARDTATMLAVIRPGVVVQTVGTNLEGNPFLATGSMDDLVKHVVRIPDSVQFRENLLDYQISVDGNMANAWTPYAFYLQGAFHHCGVNSFQLFHDGKAWQIIYLIDTRRREGCEE